MSAVLGLISDNENSLLTTIVMFWSAKALPSEPLGADKAGNSN
jgi:hypothetical protein